MDLSNALSTEVAHSVIIFVDHVHPSEIFSFYHNVGGKTKSHM